MSFANFTNPYKSSADVPENYRKHPNLSRLFQYKQVETETERYESEAIVTAAKARVERMILGEEVGGG